MLLACVEVTTRKAIARAVETGYYPQSMARLIAERIAQLRKEAQIQAMNARESNSDSYENREAMRQRRAERLQEIMDELRALMEWKKP